MEHFSQHEQIEKEEAERLAKFQGISVEEVLKYQKLQDAAAQSHMAVRLLLVGATEWFDDGVIFLFRIQSNLPNPRSIG